MSDRGAKPAWSEAHCRGMITARSEATRPAMRTLGVGRPRMSSFRSQRRFLVSTNCGEGRQSHGRVSVGVTTGAPITIDRPHQARPARSNFRDLQAKKRKAILAFARGGDRFHERPIARAMAIRSTLQARRLPPAAVRLQRSAAKSYIYFACALGNFAVEFAFSKIVKAPLKEAAPDAFAEVAQNRRRHLLLHARCWRLSFSPGFLARAARVPRASNLPLGMRGGSACF
jgi:hypothetical protein